MTTYLHAESASMKRFTHYRLPKLSQCSTKCQDRVEKIVRRIYEALMWESFTSEVSQTVAKGSH